ncbi:MAG: carbohydrate ABC transporter permease [Oscillospiraceae bacterium]|jgi:putative aldouronate transport system permease protein|nr:carbohydrate ABC transporter permease [Oscillospiraceae bacterium]
MSFQFHQRRSGWDVANYIVLAMISLTSMIPLLYVISISFTDPAVYIPLRFQLLPPKASIAAYKYILSTNSFMNALKSTSFITLAGTLCNLIATYTFAYALTKRGMPLRKLMIGVITFNLIFSVGLIPNYLLIKNLGLMNSYWALILGGLTNSWSLIVVRSFMDSLPKELEESATIDGCNELMSFLRVILPLSMPSIAAFTLFFAVGHWNTYFNALIYLSDSTKWTLQVLVKSLVIDSNSGGVGASGAAAALGDERVLPQETIRMASIVLSMAPILCVYPFLQKYFVKGVMLGAVKG